MSKPKSEFKVVKNGGAKHYLIRLSNESSFKHHRYNGPAIEPYTSDSEYKKSYYLFGIKHEPEVYDAMTKNRDELISPFEI